MAFKSNNKKIEKTVVVKCRCCGNTSREITDSFWKESDIESFERRWSEEGIVDININPFGYQFVLCDNCLSERAGDYMDKLTLPEIKGTEKQLEYVLGFRNNFVKEFFLDIQRMFVKLELEDRYFKKYDLSDEQKAAFVKAADSFTGTTQKLTEMMQKLLNSKKGTDVDFWFNVNRRGLSLEEISEIIYPIEELVECNIRMSDFESDMRDFLREMDPKDYLGTEEIVEEVEEVKEETTETKEDIMMEVFKKLESIEKEIKELKNENECLKKEIKELKNEKQSPSAPSAPSAPKNARGAGRKFKLTEEQVKEIKEKNANGVSMNKLATEYSCSVGLIYNVCKK